MTQRLVDRRVYEEEIAPWLPSKIIDSHVHIGLADHFGPIAPERYKADWAMEVGVDQSWEQLRESLAMLLPCREVSVLAMGVPFQEVDLSRNNDYVLAGALEPENRALALFVTRPEWDASVIERALSRGFVGIKPYPDMAPNAGAEPSIFDFLPKAHLEVLDRLGGVLMLHLPRKGRLADPDNIRELLELADTYPSIRLIVAHIGRSFCLPTVQRGLPHFADRKNIHFDISANLNADVFAYALETVGPERLIYGSDLPITLMRGVREHVGEDYINFTDGAYSWNTNRKSPEVEADYTFFLYEELKAIIAAVQRVGMGKEALERITYSNAAALLRLG